LLLLPLRPAGTGTGLHDTIPTFRKEIPFTVLPEWLTTGFCMEE